MESKNTDKSGQNTSRYMVTYTTWPPNQFGAPTKLTEEVQGDLGEWYRSMMRNPAIGRLIIDFAILIW